MRDDEVSARSKIECRGKRQQDGWLQSVTREEATLARAV